VDTSEISEKRARLEQSGRDWGVLKAYDYRNGAHRAPIAALEADEGPHRLRHERDAVWPPKDRAYGGTVDDIWQRAAAPALIVARLILPVTLLVTLLGAAYLFTDAFLILPAAPRSVQNAMLAGLAILGLVALFNPGDVDNWINSAPALSWRAMSGFSLSFLFANFVAITFFDAARGPRWRTAPLSASFAASLAFSAVYYPAAFAGGEVPWTDSALVHFGLFFAESVLLLVPYCLLRPAMRPLHGMNGY
jgi:hypothetical protein